MSKIRNLSVMGAVVVGALLGSGCSNLFEVKSSGEGIPYHTIENYRVKLVACRQRVHSISRVEYLGLPGKEEKEISRINYYTENDDCASSVISGMLYAPEVTKKNESFDPPKECKENELKKHVPPALPPKGDINSCAENETGGGGVVYIGSAFEWRTRPGPVKYFNVEKPFMGSASSSLKFNDKGQIVEVGANTDDKTFENILGTFEKAAELFVGEVPLTEVLAKKWEVDLEDTEKQDPEISKLGLASPKKSVRVAVLYRFEPRNFITELNNECKDGVCEYKSVSMKMVETEKGNSESEKRKSVLEFSGAFTSPAQK